MHFYAFSKIRTAFSPGLFSSIVICAFMVVMILSPIFVRMAEKAGVESLPIVLAYAGYTWMGGILIFFVAGICVDIFRILVHVSGAALGRDVTSVTSAHLVYFFLCLSASVFVTVYGSFEARNIVTEHIVIKTTKISADVGRVRIAQISDVHLGLIVGEATLESVVRVLRGAKPDIVVSTGDLLDGQPDKVESFIDKLQEVYAPHGKYAVSGNHEVYFDRTHGPGLSKELTEKAGFRLLSKDYPVHALPGLITLAGVDDEAGRGYRSGDNAREENICSQVDQSSFVILLKHRPVPYTGSSCAYDLQLSGHTHKGQIFPFCFVTRLFFKHYAGLYELRDQAYLYVSRGSGTWGPPVRFLAPPEVTIIDVVHEAGLSGQ